MARFSDEAISRMLQGRKTLEPVEFPGLPSVKVGVRILSEEEIDSARIAAAAYCKERRVDVLVDPDFLDRAVQREIVAAAYFDLDAPADEPRVFFSSGADVRKLDAPIQRVLFEAYLSHQDEVSPLRRLNDAECDEVIDRLGEGRSAEALLNACDAFTLRRLLRSLGSALRETRQTSR